MKKLIVLAVLIAATLLLLGCTQEKTTEQKKEFKAAFVYIGPVGDAGWSYAHDQGRKFIEKKYGIKTSYSESVPEGEAERVIREYAEQGYNIIFTTSFGYMDPTIAVAKDYPNIVFEHCSGYKTAKNVGTYFGRIYQADYLTGIVAGMMTKSNKIGYVAPVPIPEVIRGINAFALGVKKVNPNATVHVVWVGTWYDPAKEREAAESLINEGCDVIAQGQDSPAAQQVAQEHGVHSIGYNSDMYKFAPKAHLTAAIWNWSVVYDYIVKNVMEGKWKSEKIWWGIDKGLVELAQFNEVVPEKVKKIVQEEKEKYLKGEVPEQYPFVGPIYDQQGKLVKAKGEVMNDEELLSMMFFVDNVVGEIPK